MQIGFGRRMRCTDGFRSRWPLQEHVTDKNTCSKRTHIAERTHFVLPSGVWNALPCAEISRGLSDSAWHHELQILVRSVGTLNLLASLTREVIRAHEQNGKEEDTWAVEALDILLDTWTFLLQPADFSKRIPFPCSGMEAVMRWLSEILVQPDWLEECGFAEQSQELCYMAEDGQGDILGAASRPGLPLFGSEAVQNPSSDLKDDAEMRHTCSDVVFHAGGSIWALDWCPRRSGWSSQNIQNEFLLVGAHSSQSPHHRLGEPMRGKGLLQIWAINLMPEKSSFVNADGALSSKGRGRGGKWGRGQESIAASVGISDEASNMSVSEVDTYTTLSGFNLTKGGREKARERGRGRGRGRPPLLYSEPEAGASGNVGPPESSTPGSPPETLDAWRRCRANDRDVAASLEVQASPSLRNLPFSTSLGVLPKMVLGISHEGEVTWDAKWRPVADEDGAFVSTDERECMRLGFLAAVLGDGSVQVFDVPLPMMWEVNGAQQLVRRENEPLVVQINPIFCSSDLQSNGHKSIPLSVEWSTWAPHDMLLVGCHDGTVAVFKVFPYSTPLQESRPLLFFTADFMTLRSTAWAPALCGAAGKHLIATAGHSGWVRFWDLRDPYQPVYELQISRGVVTCIDWVSDPRCMLITMDDGSVRVLALDKAATETAVTGRPYTGTPTQGLASYYASYYAMWGVHVSRQSGLVAYCGTDGNVLQFQLTEKALIKEGSRYREPHFLCGVFAADTEIGTLYIVTPNFGRSAQLKETVINQPTPQFRRDFLTRRNAVLKSNGAGSGFIPSGNPLDMEKPGNKKKRAEDTPSGKSKKSKLQDAGYQAGEEGREPAGDFQTLPQRVVAVQRLRWNSNSGKETWLAYGGAAGIIRCQYVLPKQ